MQQRLPAPLGSEQRPDVVVLSPGTRPAAPASPVLRLALQMAPDVLRALERSRSQKQTLAPAMPAPRTTVHGMSMSEVELDIRLPLVRRVVVRKASTWAADLPVVTPAPRRGGLLRRIGMLSIGAFAAATIGVVANRASGLVGPGWRRS